MAGFDGKSEQTRSPLAAMFRPRAVAVIGATERQGSLGRAAMWNLMTSTFGGVIYPLNPKRSNVLGIKAYASLSEISEPIDLAIIALPAKSVPTAVSECAAHGVRGVVIISAGFQETGAKGQQLQDELTAVLAQHKELRLIGPNSWGIMLPRLGLNASVARGMAQAGSVGFISQSGALCSAILDWSLGENVGFSAFISVGSMLDVNWADLIYMLGDDPQTKSIVMYMETIGDARAFLSAAREVALTKPIIVIKPGRTAEAAHAVVSHTGVLTQADAVITAAFRRCGVLRVSELSDLFHMAETLGKQPRPIGNKLTIVTNAGGPGILATDALILGGGQLTQLSAETKAALSELLPTVGSHNNPVDLLSGASRETFKHALEIVLADKGSHGLLVVLTPQGQSDPTGTAEELVQLKKKSSKPILASWMGGTSVSAGTELLNQGNIPTFDYPDTAVRLFNYMWRYDRTIQSLYETPQLPDDTPEELAAHGYASTLLAEIRQTGRTLLTEYESKLVLAAYNIPTVDTRLVQTEAEAVDTAVQIGYPVVVKLNSTSITHKSAVGGVWLDLRSDEEVRHACHTIRNRPPQAESEKADFEGVTIQPFINSRDGYELIIGSAPDPDFGPVILFGMGGTQAEMFRDQALGLPPLNSTLARRLMEHTKIFPALASLYQGQAVDLSELENLLVRFSQLIVENPAIKEVDINPVLVTAEQILVLDARILLHDTAVNDDQLPQLAIRPYPKQYSAEWVTKAGLVVTIRPIRPEDEPLMVEFHKTLSDHSVYLRYFQMLNLNQRTAHERLMRLCFIDYDREMALVAERAHPETSLPQIIAVGRLTKIPHSDEAEFATLVSDDYHGQGLGTKMLNRLIEIANVEQIGRIMAYTLPENRSMKHLFEREGFQFSREDGMIKAVLPLRLPAAIHDA